MFQDKVMLLVVSLFITTITILLYAGVVTPQTHHKVMKTSNNKPSTIENRKSQVSVSNTLPPYQEKKYQEEELLDFRVIDDPRIKQAWEQYEKKYPRIKQEEYETIFVNKATILPIKHRRIFLPTGMNTATLIYLEQKLGINPLEQYQKGDDYRSCSEQRRRYEAYAKEHGYEEADKTIERPLHSEHQIRGLAMDLRNSKGNLLGTDPEDQKIIEQLQKDSPKTGWIIRYPKGKEHITGYKYRPYHLRFVGQELATKLYQNNQTLEEHFNYLNLKNEYFYPYDHISNYQHLDSIGCTIDGE